MKALYKQGGAVMFGCHRSPRCDYLSLSLFCHRILDALILLEEGNEVVTASIKMASSFLNQFPLRKIVKRPRTLTYGMKGLGSGSREMTYEQVVLVDDFVKAHKLEFEKAKRKLLLILKILGSPFGSCGNARKAKSLTSPCIDLFYHLSAECLWAFETDRHYRLPKGIEKLCKAPPAQSRIHRKRGETKK